MTCEDGYCTEPIPVSELDAIEDAAYCDGLYEPVCTPYQVQISTTYSEQCEQEWGDFAAEALQLNALLALAAERQASVDRRYRIWRDCEGMVV